MLYVSDTDPEITPAIELDALVELTVNATLDTELFKLTAAVPELMVSDVLISALGIDKTTRPLPPAAFDAEAPCPVLAAGVDVVQFVGMAHPPIP